MKLKVILAVLVLVLMAFGFAIQRRQGRPRHEAIATVDLPMPAEEPAAEEIPAPAFHERPEVRLALASQPRPRSEVVGVTGSGPAMSVDQRARLARELPSDLTVADVDALYRYLETPAGSGPDDKDGGVRNEVMNALRQQTRPIPGLHRQLIHLAMDERQSSVTRLYATQHLASLLVQVEEGGVEAEEIGNFLWGVLLDGEPEMSGTAMIMMYHASRDSDRVDSELLSGVVREIAGNSTRAASVRTTALTVAHSLRDRSLLPDARRWVQDGEQPASLRRRALLFVADLGSTADREWLQTELAGLDSSLLEGPEIGGLMRSMSGGN